MIDVSFTVTIDFMKLSEIHWGDDSAEKDPYLLNYFVESTAFKRLRDRQKSMIVGRKGAGKSAVRKKLEEAFQTEDQTHVVNLSPKVNSIKTILNDKDIAGVFGKEIFFQHTWVRQILLDCLCVVGNQSKGKYVKESMEFARGISVDLKRTSKDLVENISDVLTRIKAKVGDLGEFGLALERELRNVADVDALEFHFKSIAQGGAKFVVLVDDLDVGWDNSESANNLLLGLLSAEQYLSALTPNMFVCVFLREDVYSLLITQTQHSDKYRNIERLRWDKNNLMSILSERINYNRAKHGLPRVQSPLYGVFPRTVGTSNTDNWLYERTLGRPRELIQFSRYYTEAVEDELPNDNALKQSEQNYSEWKLADLCSEYSNQYPGLHKLFDFWKTNHFKSKYHLKRNEIEDILLATMAEKVTNFAWFEEVANATDVPRLLQILYEIGFIGDFLLGGEGGSKTVYSYQGQHEPRFDEVQIHPCFRRAVATVERIRGKAVAAK